MRYRRFCIWLPFLLISLLLTSCCLSTKTSLPEGGFDYRLTDGVLLGYPIPRRRSNDYCLSFASHPTAYRYNDENYEALPVTWETITTDTGTTAIPQAGGTYFSYRDDSFTVYEGTYNGSAVVQNGQQLFLFSPDKGSVCISNACTHVYDVQRQGILFAADGILMLYDHTASIPISDETVQDAWFIRDAAVGGICFFTADAMLFYSDSPTHDASPCRIQPMLLPDTAAVCIRGSIYGLCGTDDAVSLCHLFTGDALPTGLTGLFRFGTDSPPITQLPLSPDGRYLYLYDIDMIYRVPLFAFEAPAMTENEALIFENRCILSSITAVTNDILLLSQGENEYTEYVPVITPAVFVPTLLEEDDPDQKIDI